MEEGEPKNGIHANNNSVAAGDNGNAAGRDINAINIHNYLENKGVKPFKVFRNDPKYPIKDAASGVTTVDNLRADLLLIDDPRKVLPQPAPVTIRGTLYPCALLVSGWWTREQTAANIKIPEWDNDIQSWLFHGFHEWGPSWDYSWNFDDEVIGNLKPYFIAQLGEGDEANSIPVIIPLEKAKKLHEKFLEKGHQLGIKAAGFDVEISGLLTHRIHFSAEELQKIDLQDKDILNFCIWLKADEKKHAITTRMKRGNDMYSGYLWKLIAPQKALQENKMVSIGKAYFVWEHTNFLSRDSVNYNLDSLEHKVSYIEQVHANKHGKDDFILLQKSSALVSGQPVWGDNEFYNYFLNKEDTDVVI